jgi:hypothetical protein
VMLLGGYHKVVLMTLVVTRSLTQNLPLKEAFIKLGETRKTLVHQE